MTTVTHVQIGEQSFGISPGDASIFVTLRTSNDDSLSQLDKDVRGLVSNISKQFKLTFDFEIFDHFAASINDKEAHDIAVNAMKSLNIKLWEYCVPMRASEDFGYIWQAIKSSNVMPWSWGELCCSSSTLTMILMMILFQLERVIF